MSISKTGVQLLTEHLIGLLIGHDDGSKLFLIACHGQDLEETPCAEELSESDDRSFVDDHMGKFLPRQQRGRALECGRNDYLSRLNNGFTHCRHALLYGLQFGEIKRLHCGLFVQTANRAPGSAALCWRSSAEGFYEWGLSMIPAKCKIHV